MGQIRRNEVSVHTWKNTLRGRVLLSFSSLLLFSLVVIPRGVFPRRTAASSGSSPGVVVDCDTYALGERAWLSPGLSRLGQYRKRLTCTLTRIHGATCAASLYQHIALLWRRPATDLWHRPTVYWNGVCHKPHSTTIVDSHKRKCVLLSCILDAFSDKTNICFMSVSDDKDVRNITGNGSKHTCDLKIYNL